MTYPQDLAALIVELHQRLKLTQEQLAARLGVTFTTGNRWENHHPLVLLSGPFGDYSNK